MSLGSALKFLIVAIGIMASGLPGIAQPTNKKQERLSSSTRKTENIIMIALDGMRWQEVFGGVDSSILHDSRYTKSLKDLQNAYWDKDPSERRKKLMPFFWTTLAQNGQLYGNRALGSNVDVANPYKLTY